MTNRIKISEMPGFDAAEYLDSEAAIAAYLAEIEQEQDADLLAAALDDVARARIALARNAPPQPSSFFK